MNIDQPLLNELSELVFLSLEEGLDKEQQQCLEELLEQKPLALKYYFLLINTYLGVQEPSNLKVLHGHGQNVPYDIELWKTLAKGLAEITFDDGAVVVVEGPVVFELESPKSMFLTSGSVSAVVFEYATGFTVNTKSGSIVDLGTEFGVKVDGDGSCSVHMFKGMANLIAGQPDKKKTSQTINANEARSIDFMTGAIEEIKLEDKSFVRHIDSDDGFVWRGQQLDMADIVGGGNGFGTGTMGYGFYLATGSQVKKECQWNV